MLAEAAMTLTHNQMSITNRITTTSLSVFVFIVICSYVYPTHSWGGTQVLREAVAVLQV